MSLHVSDLAELLRAAAAPVQIELKVHSPEVQGETALALASILSSVAPRLAHDTEIVVETYPETVYLTFRRSLPTGHSEVTTVLFPNMDLRPVEVRIEYPCYIPLTHDVGDEESPFLIPFPTVERPSILTLMLGLPEQYARRVASRIGLTLLFEPVLESVRELYPDLNVVFEPLLAFPEALSMSWTEIAHPRDDLYVLYEHGYPRLIIFTSRPRRAYHIEIESLPIPRLIHCDVQGTIFFTDNLEKIARGEIAPGRDYENVIYTCTVAEPRRGEEPHVKLQEESVSKTVRDISRQDMQLIAQLLLRSLRDIG